ncbi:2 beta-glucan [Gloeopeniophorella convolvens]|nr:2 beta-glucan [Gloeopeniophorella convolvens]
MKLAVLASAVALAGSAAAWSLTDTFSGNGFFDNFQFVTAADPTKGRVVYVSESTAQSSGLAYVSGGNFFIRADDTTKLSASGPGRNSVRIMSNKQWDQHVTVYNILHMPQGCGTWPAVWENGDNWPAGGEIDIVEGVNDQGADTITLHTSSGCSMPASRDMTGSHTGLTCDSPGSNNNAGCGVAVTQSNSYGPSFNANGGGWYAVERSNNFIKVWFWRRNDASVPSDVKNGASTADSGSWGTPDAYFPNTSCDINAHFGPANIIVDIDLCGSWAGTSSVYAASGCPSTCVDYVNNNPSAFNNAYFEFAWIKVYQ